MNQRSFRRWAGAAVLAAGAVVGMASVAGPAFAAPQRSMGGPARVQPITVTVPSRGGPVRPDTVVYVAGRPVVIEHRPVSPPPGFAAPMAR